MPTTPPPLPNGHQPVDGEGIRRFTVRAARGKDYQSEAVELEYEFPRPLSYSEAAPALDATARAAGEEAQSRLNEVLAAKNDERDAQVAAAQAALSDSPAPAPAPAPFKAPPVTAPTTTEQAEQVVKSEFPDAQQIPAGNGEPNWLWAEKPNGKGRVRYLPKSVISTMELVDGAKKVVEAAGIPETEVHVFDNRDRLEQNKGYSAGSVKPKNDGFLQQTMGDVFLGDVEFFDDGQVKVYLNKDGQAAVTAIKAARAAQSATPGI